MTLSGSKDLYIPIRKKETAPTAQRTYLEHKKEKPNAAQVVAKPCSSSLMPVISLSTPTRKMTTYTISSPMSPTSASSTTKPQFQSNATTSTKSSMVSPPTPTLPSDSFPSNLPKPSTRLPDLHHFTICTHSSPPANRPLNVQPTFSFLPPHPTAISTIAGRCHGCDISHRRDFETRILLTYGSALEQRKLRLKDFRAKAGSGELAGDEIWRQEDEIERLLRRQEEAVRAVWIGFSARWGPGTIGTEKGKGGRMRVEWIRPEMQHC